MWSKVVLILVYFTLSGETCSTGYFQCYSSGCIPNYQVCDGKADCSYGDDEDNCYRYSTTTRYPSAASTVSCSGSQFQCNNGNCISGSWVCDGYNDCSSGEDERGCQTSPSPGYTTTRCNGFQCYNGECIPWYSVCNGYYECSNGEDEYYCTTTTRSPFTTNTHAITQHTTTTAPSVCNNPYELVGNRCIFVDPVTVATWNEARYVCERFEGDLIILDSLQFFVDIIHHINENGLTARDYWIGGSNAAGNWKWLDGSRVTMGTPFWAIYGYGSDSYEQEPRGTNKHAGKQNIYSTTAKPGSNDCAFLNKNRFFYMDDNACDQMKAFICQVPTWQTSAKSSPEIPTIKEIGEERLKEILASSKLEKPE